MKTYLTIIATVFFLLAWNDTAFAQQPKPSSVEQNVEDLLLKDYRPVSVFNIP